MFHVKASGVSLESRTAIGGTVTLVVDHGEEFYAVDQNAEYDPRDFAEILEYLDRHGYELMDEIECPPDVTATGLRYWAACKEWV